MKANLIHFFILISLLLIIIADIGDNDAAVIKNRVWEGYETNIGAHYYAYSPYSTEYSTVTTFVKLPKKLNVNGGQRKAFISLGVLGLRGSIGLGIVNFGNGWCPYYSDPKKKIYKEFTNKYAPYGTDIVGIQIEVTQKKIIIFSLTFRRSNLKVLDNYVTNIDATHLLVYENSKVKFRFFRFVKLAPNNGVDNQNDGTYMLGGQFTGLTIVKNQNGRDWGIGLNEIEVAWRVSSKIKVSYDGTTDIFDIKHEGEIDNKLTEEEIEIFRTLPELRFSSVSIKLNSNEDSIKLKMKVPFDDCFEFLPNNNNIDVNLYSTSGDLINLKSDESCYSFKKDKILYIKIKTVTGGNIDISMKFKQYKNYLPYHPIDKNTESESFDNIGLNEPSEIKYQKRRGEALYINCNNPERLYEKDINKPIIRNYLKDKEVFFTMEHNCQYKGAYMGYRIKNIGNDDLYITVRNIGYYVSPFNGDWTAQKEWVDFYNVNFRFRNQDKLSPEDLEQLKKIVKEEYTAIPKVPITYRIPPGEFFFVIGGTSKDAYNNINVYETADIIINGGIANGVVLFDLKGTAEGILFYYTNYQSINDNDRSSEILLNGKYDDGNDIGAQYKGYDECHGVIDGYASWKFNDQTPSQFLPVKIVNYFRDGESLVGQPAYSEISDTKRHEFIKSSWITNSNVQKSSEVREAVIGSDITDFNIYKSDLNYIVIDNNHYDGRGKVANTANWMVHYITSYHFINLGDREREVTITISGHGVVACFAVDSNGYIINDSEQFSLFDKESGKVIVHDFTYTTKIGAKSEVKVYVEHNLLANSYGNVIHKAYLN